MRPHRPARLLALLLTAVLVLVACGGDDGDVGTGSDPGGTSTAEPSPADPLDGRTFVATEITEAGAPRPLVEGTELRLSFRDGDIAIDAGCNQIGTAYAVDGDTLTVSAGTMTEMGCDPPRHEQDEWIAGVLAGEIGWSLDGESLTLTAGDTVITLLDREVASPDIPLTGTEWRLDTLLDGDVASSSPGLTGSLTLADDATYAIDTGCNTGSGTVEVAGTTLTFGPPGLTRLACEGDAAAVEAAMLAVLDGEVAYEIDERRLTLTGPDGQGLGFTTP